MITFSSFFACFRLKCLASDTRHTHTRSHSSLIILLLPSRSSSPTVVRHVLILNTASSLFVYHSKCSSGMMMIIIVCFPVFVCSRQILGDAFLFVSPFAKFLNRNQNSRTHFSHSMQCDAFLFAVSSIFAPETARLHPPSPQSPLPSDPSASDIDFPSHLSYASILMKFSFSFRLSFHPFIHFFSSFLSLSLSLSHPCNQPSKQSTKQTPTLFILPSSRLVYCASFCSPGAYLWPWALFRMLEPV